MSEEIDDVAFPTTFDPDEPLRVGQRWRVTDRAGGEFEGLFRDHIYTVSEVHSSESGQFVETGGRAWHIVNDTWFERVS